MDGFLLSLQVLICVHHYVQGQALDPLLTGELSAQAVDPQHNLHNKREWEGEGGEEGEGEEGGKGGRGKGGEGKGGE